MAKGKTNNDGGSGLARTVSPGLLILYALGTTLGAGIYVLIGEIIGAAGAWAPLSFVLASLVAALTGASFAELTGRVPSSGGPVAWSAEAFGEGWLPIAIGWGIVASGVVSAATVATGFVSYAGVFIDWSKWWILPILVGVPTFVASVGIKQSAWFMAAMTLAGMVGLLIILTMTAGNIPDWPQVVQHETKPFGSGAMLSGILLGGFMAFYAFIGFEDIAHLAEEVKDVERSIPRAIFVTLIISLTLYISVALAAITTLPIAELAESQTPLVDMLGDAGIVVSVVVVLSLITIADGLLAQIIMASRTIHDLGERRKGAPAAISKLSSRTQTPVTATVLCGSAVLTLALLFPTGKLASITSGIVLTVFATANVALIVLKRRNKTPEHAFCAPVWVPYAGSISCLGLLLAQFAT